ncbi:MAG TPA: hypothetical protein VGF59_04135 [Bryobacteraceae bacterium]|jgi:hypothetical protein
MAPVPTHLPPGRKKKKRTARSQYWWVIPIAAAGMLAAGWWLWPRKALTPRAELPTGFIDSVATVEQEYARFYGKLLKEPEVTQRVQQAARRAEVRDYVGAVDLLEAASKQAAVPIIFNDLGVLYALLNDRSRAVNAFRDALARDIDYQPVRANLNRLKGLTANAADPVTREIEPNNTNLLANVIRLSTAVDAEIAAGINDVDCFRVNAPPAPRDLLAIRIANHSATLTPALRFFDAEMRFLSAARPVRQAGDSLTHYLAPPPNSTIYLNIYGLGGAGGAYSVTVDALKAYDSYEPNDEIFNSRRIDTGRAIEANIMDAQDTDFFSFVSPRTGAVKIEITNRSSTLIPALTTFTPDMRNSGFGPDIRTPGASLHHTMLVEEGQTYFVQVWSQANTAGEYTLLIN